MELRITGLEQVQRALTGSPAKVVRAFAVALDRAAGVIAAAVEERIPEGPEGLLKQSIRVQVEVDTAKRGGIASVGFTSEPNERNGAPQDAVALWVEVGHRMVTHKPDSKQVGNVPAHPFMRPAFDSAADRAIEVFAETLISQLTEVDF